MRDLGRLPAWLMVVLCGVICTPRDVVASDPMIPVRSLHSSYDSLRGVLAVHERSGRKDQRTVRLLCQMAWHGLDRSTSLMEEHGIQALLLARTLHDKAGEGLALSCLAQLELIRARSGTLQALALEASNLLAQHGSGFERIFGDFTLSSLDDLAGRYVDCVQHADEAVAISDSLKYTEMTVQALVNSAMAYSRLGVDSVVRD